MIRSNYVYLPENSEISEPALKDRESESASEGVAYRDLMDLMLDKAESESVSNDIVKMKRSKFFNVYCNKKTHVIRENYLEDLSKWQVKQLIMQLKLGIPHLTYKGKEIRAKK